MKTEYLVFILVVSLFLLGLLAELIRRRHLREKYAMLWFLIIIMVPVASFNQNLIGRISLFVGIKYPPTLVFIAAILGLLLLTLMLSVIDSHQTDRIITLTQKLALLEERIRRIEKKK